MSDNDVRRRVAAAFDAVEEELRIATQRFGPMTSYHEGAAVIQEEWDELWEEVKRSPSRRNPQAIRDEAMQLAAMAIRFMVDCCS